MAEVTDGRAYGTIARDPDELVEELQKEFLRQSLLERVRLPVASAQLEFLGSVAMEDPDFREVPHHMFTHRPKMRTPYAARLTARAVNMVLHGANPAYPYEHGRRRDTLAGWGQDSLETILDPDEPERYGTFVQILLGQDIVTTKAFRSWALIAGLELYHPDKEFSLLDMGSSQGHPIIQAARHGERGFEYPDIAVVQAKKSNYTDPGVSVLHPPDTRHHAQLNHLVQASKLKVAQAVGVDIQKLDDPYIQKWTLYSSFYTDHLTPAHIEKFTGYHAAKPDNVHFYYPVDITRPLDLTSARYAAMVPGAPQTFDAAFYSFILNQLDDQGVEAALQNGKDRAKRLFVLDAINFNADGAETFYDNRTPFDVSCWTLGVEQPELGWQKLFTFDSGRLNMVQVEPTAEELLKARRLRTARVD